MALLLPLDQYPLNNIQELLDRSIRLLHHVYNYNPVRPGRHGQHTNTLYHRIYVFPNILTQLSSRLYSDQRKRRNRIATQQIMTDLLHVVDQCHEIFDRIELVTKQIHSNVTTPISEVSHDEPVRSPLGSMGNEEIAYMIGLLDALASNFAVMTQTLSTAQSIAAARQDEATQRFDIVAAERRQLEALVLKQQVAIVNASNLFLEMHQNATMLDMRQNYLASGSTELVPFEKSAISPEGISRFQDPVLAQYNRRPTLVAEAAAHAGKSSEAHTDHLLQWWTRCHEYSSPQRAGKSIGFGIVLPESPPKSRQASVETDDETDIDVAQAKHSQRSSSSEDPILERIFSPRLAVPASLERTHSAPSCGSEHSRLVVPATSLSSARPGPSPAPSSIYVSYPDLSSPSTVASSPQVDVFSPVPSSPTSTYSGLSDVLDDTDALSIPWRRRVHASWWDFVDDVVVNSNTAQPAAASLYDPATVTEIRDVWAAPEALKEAGLQYHMLTRDVGGSGCTQLRRFYCIEKAMDYKDVVSLVEHSAMLYEQQDMPTPKSKPREEKRGSPFEEPPLGEQVQNTSRSLQSDMSRKPSQCNRPKLDINIPSVVAGESRVKRLSKAFEDMDMAQRRVMQGPRDTDCRKSGRYTARPAHHQSMSLPSSARHDKHERRNSHYDTAASPGLRRHHTEEAGSGDRRHSSSEYKKRPKLRKGSQTMRWGMEGAGIATLLGLAADAML